MKIATVVFIRTQGKVLLCRKKTGEIGQGTLNGPGGKLEEGETPIDCVYRETREEVVVTLIREFLKKVAIINFYANGVLDFKVHVFTTEHFEGTPQETDDMVPEWFPEDAIPYDRLAESDQHWLPQILAGERFAANVYYKERAQGFISIEFLPFPRNGG